MSAGRCARAALTVLLAGATAVAGTLALAEPAAAKRYWVPHSGVLVVHGHGYGHGHGMSQYGAEGAARAGKSYRQILRFYYPGTRRDRAKGSLRVLLTADTTSAVTVRARRGLTVRDLAGRGRTWDLPTRRGVDRWRITPSRKAPARSAVQLHDRSGWHQWRVPGRDLLRGDGQFSAHGDPVALLLPSGYARRYHGVLRSESPHRGAATRDTVNVVSLDQYVRGVLPAEMPTSWSRAALKAQAVAARTYATFGRNADHDRYWHVCDTTACQVYDGVGVETGRGNRAVRRTAHEIRAFHGRPAFTQFSSSSGGWTADGGYPYLPARRDRFDGWGGNANHDWTVRVEAASLQRRYPQLGRLRFVAVKRRDGHGQWGGRALQLRLAGSRGEVALTGEELRSVLGLRSSWLTPQHTPIMRAWQGAGGGAPSPVGTPRRPERQVRSGTGLTGARQLFTRGQMYWSRRTGAHGLHGPVLGYYRRVGGVGSRLGFPATRVAESFRGGGKAMFQRGLVVHADRAGTHAVTGAILRAYRREGFAKGGLGYPTTGVREIRLGKRMRFQRGRITFVKRTDEVHVVNHGD